MNDSDRRARTRAGKEFDRKTADSWKRVHEGSAVEANRTEQHPRVRPPGETRPERSRRARPDLRFAVRYVPGGPSHEAVFEVKDRAWDVMLPENVKRAARRDRAQVLRYIEDLISLDPTADGADVTAALIYRRSPSDLRLRDWIEEYLGQEAIAVLWQDSDPIEAEWFAATVRVVVQTLTPLAVTSSRALIVSLGRQVAPTIEMVVVDAKAGDALDVAFGSVDAPHRTALGLVWLADMTDPDRDAYFARSSLRSPASRRELTAVTESTMETRRRGFAFDLRGEREELRGAAVPIGKVGPHGELAALTVTARRWRAEHADVVLDDDRTAIIETAMTAARCLRDALEVRSGRGSTSDSSSPPTR